MRRRRWAAFRQRGASSSAFSLSRAVAAAHAGGPFHMTQRLAVFAMFATTLYSTFSGAQVPPVDDAHGKEWRQLTDTVGVSWNQVAEVCPGDGISACSGAIDDLDLTGWVWATDAQLIE